MLFAAVELHEILIPFGSALLGVTVGGFITRAMRRQELHAKAAERIEELSREATDILRSIDRTGMFPANELEEVRRLFTFARFHALRLENAEVAQRLAVTVKVIGDVHLDQRMAGIHWIHESINDVMGCVIEFMKLPRLVGPRRKRKLPPNRFPNTVRIYGTLVRFDKSATNLNWAPLRSWMLSRDRFLRDRGL